MLHQLVLNVEISFEFLLSFFFSELHFAAKTLEMETIKKTSNLSKYSAI